MASTLSTVSAYSQKQKGAATYVLIGGGIAGVSCAEMLSTICPNDKILLISATPMVKAVTNLSHLTKLIATFDIDEQTGEHFESHHSGVQGKMLHIC